MPKPVFEYDPIEAVGYKLLLDDVIKCADCGEKLVQIIKVMDSKESKHIYVKCPFCNDGESFQYKVDGQTYIQSVDGVVITDMQMEFDDNNVMHIIVETEKHEQV